MLRTDLERIRIAAGWQNLPAETVDADIQSTASDAAFPGAIIPACGPDGRTVWLAIASSPTEWRALQPLLLSHAGPTLTDFYGVGRPLDDRSPVERELSQAGATIGAALRPGPGCDVFVTRALARLVRALRARPDMSERGRLPTNKVLGALDLCLSVGDRDGAVAQLATLRDEYRVDALNQHFLEVRIFGQVRDWTNLAIQPWFEMLCFTRKPAPIAADMLRALWYARLAAHQDDESALRREYQKSVRPLAVALMQSLAPNDDAVLTRIYDLEAFESGSRVAHQVPERPRNETVARDGRADLMVAMNGEAADQEAKAVVPYTRPGDWLSWLASLSDREFAAFSMVAGEGATEWSIPSQETTTWAIQLGDAIQVVALNDGLARDRLFECLPQIIRNIRSDAAFPRSACSPLYEKVLEVLGLMEYIGANERNVALDLFDGLVSLGLSREAYVRVLGEFERFLEQGAGTTTAYWLIDVAATLLEFPAPDEESRRRLLNRVLDALQSIRAALRPSQRSAYNVVATVAGWATLPVKDAMTPREAAIPKGVSVAIYTLTESAARQAEQALLEVEPTLKISLAHDLVASPRLSRLSRDVDLFVFASSSATHAASDCIMAHRGGRPLAYAVGRGFSSLVRAVEDYFERAAVVGTA